jgi:hypothetical protein
MAKSHHKIEIQGTDKIKTLIELFAKYMDELPQELVDSVRQCADCESVEMDHVEINNLLNCKLEFKCLADGEEVKRLVSINPILKRIKYYSEQMEYGISTVMYEFKSPTSLRIFSGDNVVFEW